MAWPYIHPPRELPPWVTGKFVLSHIHKSMRDEENVKGENESTQRRRKGVLLGETLRPPSNT